MKKTMLCLLAMALVLCAMLGGLVAANRRLPTLGQQAQVPADIGRRAYAFSGLQLEDGAYRIRLEQADAQRDLVLVLAAMRPFTVTVGGRVCYEYTAASPYARVHVVPLGGGEGGRLEVEIATPSGQAWPKALLTTGARSDWMRQAALVTGCVSVGVHLMMLFTCLALYLQKHSEKYLLAQFAVALISLCASQLTAGFGELPVTEGAYVFIQRVVNSALMPSGTAICVLLAPGFWPRYRNRLVAACLAAFPLTLAAGAAGLSWLSELVAWLLFGLGALALCRALLDRMPHMPFLAFCYLLCQALRTYSQLNNLGRLPASELLVYVYLPPLRSVLLLFACMLVVDTRFAQKFRQADELVARLNETNATLDAKVAQRTAQLLQQQELRRSMMVNIFHDLRSPIFSARGCADMMSAAGEDAECLSVIKEKLDFLGTLTEQLFLMAKLEDGKITFARAAVPLHTLCAQLAEGAALEAERRGVSFTFESAGPLVVEGDGFRLKQALENLLQNAFQFTPAGGGVTLALGRQGSRAVIKVRDTGKGIAPEDLPHVFERYYQGRNSDKQRSTGLGLAIAQQIVQAHGGAIAAESRLGEGTCFTVRLALEQGV